MAPSPRKRAPPASFQQTWNDTDAAFLDTSALPVSKIPRGWERKQEIKKAGDGKEKKIWRRISLRSRGLPATEGDEEEEEHDARSRAVKRRQHMSPKTMEKTSTAPNSKTRAFKATRWDRRKSVLPRKRATRSSAVDVEAVSDIEDTTDPNMANDSSTDVDMAGVQTVAPARTLQPNSEDKRTSFTFTMEAETVEDLPDYESLDGFEDATLGAEPSPVEDATINILFRSPAKTVPTQPSRSPEKVEYPELPGNDNQGAGSELDMAGDDLAADQDLHEDIVHQQTKLLEPQTEEQAPGISERSDPGPSPDSNEIAYPTLPIEIISTEPLADHNSERKDVEMSEIELDMETSQDHQVEDEHNGSAVSNSSKEGSVDEDSTEASIQLDIQRQCNMSLEEEHSEDPQASPQVTPKETPLDDIATGLRLTPAKLPAAEATPRRLHSPPPPPQSESGPDDMTMTVAMDDDTAILKNFLNRAAASKAERETFVHRRESLQNRRDSDVVRGALSSPRKILADKDPNSPSKYDAGVALDLSQTLTLSADKDLPASQVLEQAEAEDSPEADSTQGSRRSSRAKKSRLPAPASASQAQTSKIAIRRTDGSEHVVLKKSDAQELANITRVNTRKNKQGAFGVHVRLLKLAMESYGLPPVDESTREIVLGKNIRWDEQLAYYQENTDNAANQLAEAESLATPDELSLPTPSSIPSVTPKPKASKDPKDSKDKQSTPKVRRVRGLGTANGTPGKGLLAPASLLPDAVQEEKDAASTQPQRLPKPKSSKLKKPSTESSTPVDTKLATLEITPIGIDPTKERKSRLATPKKVKLPQPTSATVAVEGKENPQRSGLGLGDATPKKGIPVPRVVIPPPAVGMESGLPRRRGRKV